MNATRTEPGQRQRRRSRRPGASALARAGAHGFSLVELLIAITVVTVVMGAAFSMLRTENQSFHDSVEQLTVLRNLRFAANALEKDLRTAGGNVPTQQPTLVYADSLAVAFNTDFATNVPGNAWAVYYDPDAPDEEVQALTASRQITIPQSSFTYPSVDYNDTGAGGGGATTNSPAETLIFYFARDSSTTRTDDWALFRQINDREPELVARGLLQSAGRHFFEYERLVDPPNAEPTIQTVAPGALPLQHSASFHLSAGDTGPAAIIDSVRAVRINLEATNGRTGDEEEIRSVSRLIRVPNAGVERKQVCGAAPVPPQNVTGTPELTPGNQQPSVVLEWQASADQEGGEEDVIRYLIFKRKVSEPDWGPPYLSIPVAASTSYSYTDQQVQAAMSYRYAVAAQDCTPQTSPEAETGNLTPPTPPSP